MSVLKILMWGSRGLDLAARAARYMYDAKRLNLRLRADSVQKAPLLRPVPKCAASLRRPFHASSISYQARKQRWPIQAAPLL